MYTNIFLVVFILLVLLTAVYYPVSGYYKIKELKNSIRSGDPFNKTSFYYSNILWSWLPVIIVFLLIPLNEISIENIGFRIIDITGNQINNWVLYPGIGLYFLHLIYNIYLAYAISSNKESRQKMAATIPDDTKLLLPVTRKEKQAWTLVSITAGITEELFYRGYLFYALALIFQDLTLIHILFITTFIFGIGHIYLGKDGIKSAMLGLLFGFYYILFDSVYPVIIIHIVQDLVVRNILKEDGS